MYILLNDKISQPTKVNCDTPVQHYAALAVNQIDCSLVQSIFLRNGFCTNTISACMWIHTDTLCQSAVPGICPTCRTPRPI